MSIIESQFYQVKLAFSVGYIIFCLDMVWILVRLLPEYGGLTIIKIYILSFKNIKIFFRKLSSFIAVKSQNFAKESQFS